MSLIKQLWIGIVSIVLVAFGSSFIVSTLSARHYLEQQLLLKNIDNATALALSMSQMPKEPVAIELLLTAQFDAGHYQSIRLVDPQQRVLVERSSAAGATEVPQWFVRLVPLRVSSGVAQVTDGWKQYGTLSVESHTRFAYKTLWNETLWLLLACLVLGVVSGTVGGLLLHAILRPLDRIVEQAQAMEARRFIITPEPRTTEFAAVARAMNSLSTRIRTMLAEEAGRLEALRREAHYDSLTGLLNRAQLFPRVDEMLRREDVAAAGAVVITRVLSLAAVNRSQGREAVDALLARLGDVLNTLVLKNPDWCAGRLNGSDFVLFAPDAPDAHALARQIHDSMKQTVLDTENLKEVALPTAATNYVAGETLSQILSRVDVTLIQAESSPYHPVQVTLQEGEPMSSDLDLWRAKILQVLDTGRVKLAEFPVRSSKGELLHVECPLRVQLQENGDWLSAGQVMPWATKLGLMQKIDAAVVGKALEKLQQTEAAVAINLSAATLMDREFHVWLIERIKARASLASRLWLEFSEAHVLRYFIEFRSLCHALQALGCHIGIEHAGHHIAHVDALHDMGLHYIKIDGAFVRGIDTNQANQIFLRGVCLITHSIGLITIAEGVQTAEELQMLPGLGVDGATGPAVK